MLSYTHGSARFRSKVQFRVTFQDFPATSCPRPARLNAHEGADPLAPLRRQHRIGACGEADRFAAEVFLAEEIPGAGLHLERGYFIAPSGLRQIRLAVRGRRRDTGEIGLREDRHLARAVRRKRKRWREGHSPVRRRTDLGTVLHALRLGAAVLEIDHAPVQLAAVRRESGADRSLNGHVAVRIPIRTADDGDAQEADWNEEPPVTAKPDELRTFEDRPELVVHVHSREDGPDLLGAAGTGLQQHRAKIRFARTRLEGIAALQRQTDLRLHQVRIEPLGVRIDVLEAWIVEPNVGIDALQAWIHRLKISVGILWLRESRGDLDRPVDMHLRSGARREHL